jgi:hypothetical protein
MLCCKKDIVLGNAEIKLDILRNSAHLSGDFAILPGEGIDTGFKGAKINVTINLRTPTVGREFTTVSKLTFQITKTFRSFKSGAAEVIKPEVKQPGPAAKKVEPVAEEVKKKPEQVKPKMSEFNPEEFRPEELEDPDYIENLVSLKVLELKIKGVEAEIAKIDGRAPPKIREKLLKMRVKYKSIESNMGEGTLSVDRYIAIMKMQMEHDRKLMAYFESKKEMPKVKQVADRIPLILKEMEEAINFAKSQK